MSKLSWTFAVGLLLTSHAIAQQAAPEQSQNRRTAQVPTDIEPAVDTSAPPANERARDESSASNVRSDAPADAPAANTPAQRAEPRGGSGGSRSRGASGSRGASDRIELDATQITGNRELPKVMYIVPWKRSDLGDLVGKPVNSLLDEVLAPVDRDVFRRENRYYQTLSAQQPQAGTGAAQPGAQAAQPEK
jgi:hypothetical protein